MSLSGEKLVKNQEQETTLTNIADDEIDSRPRPRLCHLKKWPHFQGYGFNLHAERAKTGQHIGKVDVDSPAESAGLKEGDRIIEVNNVNISNENHQQVVKRIRNGLEKNGKFYEDEVILLVLDHEADVYYRNLNIIVKSDFKNILRYSTKSETEDENNNENNYVDQNQKSLVVPNDNTSVDKNTLNDATNTVVISNSLSSISQKSINSNSMENSSSEIRRPIANDSSDVQNENLNNVSSTSMNNKSSNKDIVSSASNLSISSNNQSNSSKATTPNIQTKDEKNIYTENKTNNSLDSSIYEHNSMERRNVANQNNKLDPFQMSAVEFKTYLKSKGRVDPRITQVDMRQKFQMFQDM